MSAIPAMAHGTVVNGRLRLTSEDVAAPSVPALGYAEETKRSSTVNPLRHFRTLARSLKSRQNILIWLEDAGVNMTKPAEPERPSVVDHALIDIHERYRNNRSGALADYIPELAVVDPDRFGIVIASADGRLFSVGDTTAEFTIQSISKALAYCLSIELAGRDVVANRVGVEPSGDPFNAIEFDPRTKRPYNPMINAGAIAVSGIIRDESGADAFRFLLERFSKAAGRSLSLDENVYRSESETGHRNRAIAHLLLGIGVLRPPVDDALDLYFRQCSISVNVTDLAVMGATLANLGENPLTHEQVFDMEAVRHTLSVMFTCGMYDYSGNWAHDVGIPAKSGVGGGIMGVVNRQLGIGAFSPRLDQNGNSVRGIESFKALAEEFGLHAFDPGNQGSAFMSSVLSGKGLRDTGG
ncbi:glutaminase A [Agrobacterium vitis]|nr:glutaminase A [Agrobacterium vitis]